MRALVSILLCLCASVLFTQAKVLIIDPCATARCGYGKVCRLQKVECFTAPCPPTVTCEDPDPTAVDPCAINLPILGADSQPLFCGRGLNRVTCPDYTTCTIHETDKYAVCCYTGPPSTKG